MQLCPNLYLAAIYTCRTVFCHLTPAKESIIFPLEICNFPLEKMQIHVGFPNWEAFAAPLMDVTSLAPHRPVGLAGPSFSSFFPQFLSLLSGMCRAARAAATTGIKVDRYWLGSFSQSGSSEEEARGRPAFDCVCIIFYHLLPFSLCSPSLLLCPGSVYLAPLFC